jgi:hypothetical protein
MVNQPDSHRVVNEKMKSDFLNPQSYCYQITLKEHLLRVGFKTFQYQK